MSLEMDLKEALERFHDAAKDIEDILNKAFRASEDQTRKEETIIAHRIQNQIRKTMGDAAFRSLINPA